MFSPLQTRSLLFLQLVSSVLLVALRKEVEAANAEFTAAFAAKDLERLTKAYCEDCTLMPPLSPTAKGRKGASIVF